ncbi:MAG: YitT family protein, partial [Opitutae bacterium]|nr:YitT family protein [Opitutae bacterium]
STYSSSPTRSHVRCASTSGSAVGHRAASPSPRRAAAKLALLRGRCRHYVFISSIMIDYTLSIFSQRKVVYIISGKYQEIAKVILRDLKRGATIIKAEGAYSGKERNMLMTITNNVQLKRLEEVVFTIDADAMFIVENTFNVIGSAFGKRKLY